MTKKEIRNEIDWWLKNYLEERIEEENRSDRTELGWVVERNIERCTNQALATVSIAYGLGLIDADEHSTICSTIIYRRVKR